MVMSSKMIKIIFFFISNLMLLILLYNIPVDSAILNKICLIKIITGKECWNCGMTRAFLYILHFDFYEAYEFNHKVLIVFPLTIGIYLYSWYRYIFEKGDVKNE